MDGAGFEVVQPVLQFIMSLGRWLALNVIEENGGVFRGLYFFI